MIIKSKYWTFSPFCIFVFTERRQRNTLTRRHRHCIISFWHGFISFELYHLILAWLYFNWIVSFHSNWCRCENSRTEQKQEISKISDLEDCPHLFSFLNHCTIIITTSFGLSSFAIIITIIITIAICISMDGEEHSEWKNGWIFPRSGASQPCSQPTMCNPYIYAFQVVDGDSVSSFLARLSLYKYLHHM